MTMKMSAKELLHANKLQTLGIPLDAEVLQKSQDACRGLWIEQDPNTIDTYLFDLDSGGTAVLMSLSARNVSDRVIRISAARLDIHWCKQIRWQEELLRKVPPKHFYSVPTPTSLSYARDVVLNHPFRINRKLFPGDWMEGYLLGCGDESIPDQYRERELFKARLSFYDTRNNVYPLDLKLLFNRKAIDSERLKIAKETLPARLAKRRSIFSNPDPTNILSVEELTQTEETLGQIVVPNKNVGARVQLNLSGEKDSGAGNTKVQISRGAGDASTNSRPPKVAGDDETVTRSAGGPRSESGKRKASRRSVEEYVPA